MTWAKIDDQLHSHPKLTKLGPLLLPCLGLYTLSLSWVSAYLTDGILSLEQATRLAGIEAENLVERLCFAGFFDKVDEGTYQIHDYLDYNPSKKHALKVKKIRALVGSKGGKQKSSNLLESCLQVAVANGKQKSTPSPSPSLKTKEPPISPKGDDGFVQFWQTYPRHVAKQDAAKAWKKLKPSLELIQTLMVALQKATLTQGWRKDNGKFIPYPASWLNGRRWEDDLSSADDDFFPFPVDNEVTP